MILSQEVFSRSLRNGRLKGKNGFQNEFLRFLEFVFEDIRFKGVKVEKLKASEC